MTTTTRFLASMFAVALVVVARSAFAQAYCAPPKTMPKTPPPPPPPPVCQPQACGKCTTSPCYVDSGIYVNDVVDLSVPTNGFSLLVARHYDSSLTVDGPLGIGWSSSLTPRLYYAAYLYATNVYQYEADVLMPDGARFRFSGNANGTFTAPLGRHDSLVRNADGTFTMTLQRSRSVLSFAADGCLTTMADDFGNALTFSYDANGRVQTVADASGSSRSLTVTWNPQGRIADVSDSATPARHIIYSYDADGMLASMRDPVTPSGQQSASYAYTAGRYGPVLSRIDDRWGRVVSRLVWQNDGKLQSYTEGDYNDANPPASTGEKYVYTYGQSTTTKTSSVGSVNHTYTSNGLITDHAQYDINGNPTALTTVGYAVTYYQYDSRGNISVKTRYENSGRIDWFYTYDPTYPDKVSTITPKDSNGNVATNYASWIFDYNAPTEAAPGALKRVRRYNTTRTATQTLAEYAYDAKGHVTSITDDALRVSTFQYDVSGNLLSATVAGRTTTYGYDSLGRATSATDAAGHVTSATYDALDRPLTVRLPRPSSTSTLDFVTTYSYDNYDSGLVYTVATDANGRVTRSGYDALGHVIRSVDALGNATVSTYQYNLLKSVTDANGNVLSYDYDANRHLSRTTFPDGAVESVTAAWDGTIASITDRRGTTTQYARDSVGRATNITYSAGGVTLGTVNYTYNGELLTSVSYGTTSTSFTYDSFWRRATETRTGEYTITYQYAPLTAALVAGYILTPAAGKPGPTVTVGSSYDANQQVNAISVGGYGTFTIDYDALGRYSRITYPYGQTREFAYDDQSRLTLVRNRHPNAGDIATFQYEYDYDWSTGTYSMLGQRTSVTMTGSATPYPYNTQIKYTYDGNYQLAGLLQGSSVRSWAYDAIGNRTSATGPGYSAYAYYKNGTNPLNGRRLQNDGMGGDFTYDANGNVTGRGGTVLYTWDYANRLAAASGTSYTYDYLGRRISVTDAGGTTTKYIPFGQQTIGERTGNVARDYIFAPGIDEPLAKIENGTLTNYSADGVGSVVATTDPSGTILSSFAYDPWGVISPLQGTAAFFGYTGREATGGLWYLRARYYDPSIGRFLNEDPPRRIAPGSLPEYAYANNDPLSYRDPFGYYNVSLHRRRLQRFKDPSFLQVYCKRVGTGKSCTKFLSSSSSCTCLGCMAGLYHISISVDIAYDQFLTPTGPANDPDWQKHEDGHVDDIREALGNYLDGLEQGEYSDEAQCEKGCERAVQSIDDVVKKAAQQSQQTRH